MKKRKKKRREGKEKKYSAIKREGKKRLLGEGEEVQRKERHDERVRDGNSPFCLLSLHYHSHLAPEHHLLPFSLQEPCLDILVIRSHVATLVWFRPGKPSSS